MGARSTKIAPYYDDSFVVVEGQKHEQGKAVSKPALTASSVILNDPRWDRAAFDLWSRACAPFVRAGYLREIVKTGGATRSVPASELHREMPAYAGIKGVQIFAVLSPSLL